MRKENSPFFSPQDTAYSGCPLLSTIAPAEDKCKPGSIGSTNKAANTEYLSDHRAAMLSAAPLLLSNKSLMEDLELLNSEWDTINALVFLINDVGYGNRDKLTLLAAVQCVCVSVCVCVCVKEVDGDRQRQRGRQV